MAIGLTNVTALDLGHLHGCAIDGNGDLWCWGDALLAGGSVLCWGENGAGQLGDDGPTRRGADVVYGVPSEAVAVAAGEGHTCAAFGNGQVWCWGASEYGQTGSDFALVAPPGRCPA